MNNFLSHLECSKTGEKYNADSLHNLSDMGAPLLARYNIPEIKNQLSKADLQSRNPDMWRYKELLPVSEPPAIISLGEGYTPLRNTNNLGRVLGFSNLHIKDESLNPTGSFKARGLSAAVSSAIDRGADSFAIPSAGNAAGALSAYAAQAGVDAHVFMPKDTPPAFHLECEYFGANIELVDGLITDCGSQMNKYKKAEGWFDVSTLKEPYRIEGKKTMGFELAEQLDWSLPDVIVYPTGGGTGLIGMWKAFQEMEELGWIGSERPRMVSVQAKGCAPIVKAFQQGSNQAEPWKDAETTASGLRVPGAIGDFLILQALYESKGSAVAVSDNELMNFSKVIAEHTGILPAPEGGATLAGLMKLKEQQLVDPEEQVVLFNTGSGYKYQETLSRQDRETTTTYSGLTSF